MSKFFAFICLLFTATTFAADFDPSRCWTEVGGDSVADGQFKITLFDSQKISAQDILDVFAAIGSSKNLTIARKPNVMGRNNQQMTVVVSTNFAAAGGLNREDLKKNVNQQILEIKKVLESKSEFGLSCAYLIR